MGAVDLVMRKWSRKRFFRAAFGTPVTSTKVPMARIPRRPLRKTKSQSIRHIGRFPLPSVIGTSPPSFDFLSADDKVFLSIFHRLLHFILSTTHMTGGGPRLEYDKSFAVCQTLCLPMISCGRGFWYGVGVEEPALGFTLLWFEPVLTFRGPAQTIRA